MMKMMVTGVERRAEWILNDTEEGWKARETKCLTLKMKWKPWPWL